MEIFISNVIGVHGAPKDIERAIRDDLTVTNPKYIEAKKMGRWLGGIEQYLHFFKYNEDGWLDVPRGFSTRLFELMHENGIPYDSQKTIPFTHDEASVPAEFVFHGTLKPFQSDAVAAMLNAPSVRMLCSGTGSGKTVMALKIIAARGESALVIVHTKELLKQWIERIKTFLHIPGDEIGIIGGGKMTVGRRITVGTVQTIYKKARSLYDCFGQVVVDECHRAPARTFYEALGELNPTYILGLTATPMRRDGLGKVMKWYVGEIGHHVNKKMLQENGYILKAKRIERNTLFTTRRDASLEYSKVIKELTKSKARNLLIISDVLGYCKGQEHAALVVSDRKSHCTLLYRRMEILVDYGVELLTGDTPAAERPEIVKRMDSGESRILVATGQLIGEGYDCKNLGAFFLTTPVKWKGRLLQYLGRILRPAEGKAPLFFDYVDERVPVLLYSSIARAKAFKGVKY